MPGLRHSISSSWHRCSKTATCYGEDGALGRAVWAMYEDGSGTLWAGAESGVWRLRPGPPQRYRTPTELIGLNSTDDGRLLMALHGAGLRQLAGDRVDPYPIRDVVNRNRLFADRDVNANKLLRDRDGGLWIGTVARGLIHLRDGRADLFTRSDGLSGDVILSLFEDREGNVWVASTGGLDRFRELPVTTISVRQGLSSEATQAVLAATDGSIWVGTDGRARWLHPWPSSLPLASNGVDDVRHLQTQILCLDDEAFEQRRDEFPLGGPADGRQSATTVPMSGCASSNPRQTSVLTIF